MGNISPFTEHGLEILPLIFSVFCELLPFHIQQNNFIKLFGSIRFNPLPFEIISRITIHLSHVPSPLTPRQDIKAFVELHIEQGCVLESNGQSIGVVNAIVGQRRYTVTLNGESNHAGTTPMGYRRDTVYAFSRICHQSVEKAKKMGDPLVLTFGKVEPRPNTVNVVPGKTTFTIDCRHTDAAVLRDFTQQLENDMRAICDEMDIGIDIDLWMDEEPVPMNKELVATLTELCESEKLNYRVMHSGAGHDAQIFAPRVPTCMIFIPSINGISHNPAERTNITDLAEGVKTLALMLYQLAWQK